MSVSVDLGDQEDTELGKAFAEAIRGSVMEDGRSDPTVLLDHFLRVLKEKGFKVTSLDANGAMR